MNFVETQKRDHASFLRDVDALATWERSRLAAWKKWRDTSVDILAHRMAEESILFPEVEKRSSALRLLLEATHLEHRQIEKEAATLHLVPVGSNRWMRGLQRLRNLLIAEANHEERSLWPCLTTELSTESLEALGIKLDRLKSNYRRQPLARWGRLGREVAEEMLALIRARCRPHRS